MNRAEVIAALARAMMIPAKVLNADKAGATETLLRQQLERAK